MKSGPLLVAVALFVAASPVAAHVRILPAHVTAGSIAALTFRCPNERATTAVTKLVVQLPQNATLPVITVRAIAGWRSSVTAQTITWQGGRIAPGKRQDFTIVAGPVPSGVDQLAFKAVQTYADGEVVRWIEVRAPGEPEPPNPAPVLAVLRR